MRCRMLLVGLPILAVFQLRVQSVILTSDQQVEALTDPDRKQNVFPGCIYYRDIYPDTWVANDALGRQMLSFSEVGALKNDQLRCRCGCT